MRNELLWSVLNSLCCLFLLTCHPCSSVTPVCGLQSFRINLLQCGLSRGSHSFRKHSAALVWSPSQAAVWISASAYSSPLRWLQGNLCPTVVSSARCRGISASSPAAPPPPASLILVLALLLLTLPVGQFYPFLTKLSQRCCTCAWWAQLCPVLGPWIRLCPLWGSPWPLITVGSHGLCLSPPLCQHLDTSCNTSS